MFFAKGARTAMSASFNNLAKIPRGQGCPRSWINRGYPPASKPVWPMDGATRPGRGVLDCLAPCPGASWSLAFGSFSWAL